ARSLSWDRGARPGVSVPVSGPSGAVRNPGFAPPRDARADLVERSQRAAAWRTRAKPIDPGDDHLLRPGWTTDRAHDLTRARRLEPVLHRSRRRAFDQPSPAASAAAGGFARVSLAQRRR